MKHGDFTELAKYYVDRPGYSLELLKILKNHIIREQGREEVIVADVGAGTGKLTENLEEIGIGGYAVEPVFSRCCYNLHLECSPMDYVDT